MVEPGLAREKITKVEFALNGQWEEAEITGQVGKFAWTGWKFNWDAKPGEHILQCRASDESGDIQPINPLGLRWLWKQRCSNCQSFC